jgi:hypothetical protein
MVKGHDNVNYFMYLFYGSESALRRTRKLIEDILPIKLILPLLYTQ